MQPPIAQALRSRWFAVCVHVGLWLLLYLAVTGLGGKPPEYGENSVFSLPAQSPAPVAKLGPLFTPVRWLRPSAETNAPNPFLTRHFAPAPPPALATTTRRLDLTYQGFYQTADQPQHALLKVSDTFINVGVGTPLVTNLYVAQATMQTLTLTNLAGQTNLLPLNVRKEIEVPLK